MADLVEDEQARLFSPGDRRPGRAGTGRLVLVVELLDDGVGAGLGQVAEEDEVLARRGDLGVLPDWDFFQRSRPTFSTCLSRSSGDNLASSFFRRSAGDEAYDVITALGSLPASSTAPALTQVSILVIASSARLFRLLTRWHLLAVLVSPLTLKIRWLSSGFPGSITFSLFGTPSISFRKVVMSRPPPFFAAGVMWQSPQLATRIGAMSREKISPSDPAGAAAAAGLAVSASFDAGAASVAASSSIAFLVVRVFFLATFAFCAVRITRPPRPAPTSGSSCAALSTAADASTATPTAPSTNPFRTRTMTAPPDLTFVARLHVPIVTRNRSRRKRKARRSFDGAGRRPHGLTENGSVAEIERSDTASVWESRSAYGPGASLAGTTIR